MQKNVSPKKVGEFKSVNTTTRKLLNDADLLIEKIITDPSRWQSI